jgi:tol-pal system protein YbgF
MRRILRPAALALALILSLPAAAQDRAQTLADIRAELGRLQAQVQGLQQELTASGTPPAAIGGGSVLDRVAAIEAELVRLTGRTEDLSNRIDRVVSDGTNRIGDLAFRLCELEDGCDIAALGDTPVLGGGSQPAPQIVPPGPPQGGAQLAVSERTDFDRAKAAFDAGEAGAAGMFESFLATYPGSPLSGEAHYWRGEALSAQGQTQPAARAFLESFSGSPQSPVAPRALFRLGVSLGQLGQTLEACALLAEVPTRFPADPAATEASAERQRLACP